MRINKYFPFAILYFFFNSVALPLGLTYTAILSPFFYWWVTVTRKKEVLLPFFFFILIYALIHKSQGVETTSYLRSVLNLTAVYIFCQAFYTFLKRCQDIENLFWKLLVINFILCLVAIPVYFTPYFKIFWIQQYLTEGVENFLRFKLFTYEASYYATLFTPLFFFFLLQVVLRQNRRNAMLLALMIFLPYILSFSLGVISCIVLAILITLILYFRTLLKNKRLFRILLATVVLIIFSLCFLLIFFPDNTFFLRIGNVLTGNDSSGRGRTYEAFEIANRLLAERSYAWGIGPGQIKQIGTEIIRDFYMYPMEHSVFTIPNTAAETLAIFGWVGFSIRIVAEIFLFIFTRVWTNYYRLLLFIFIFFYQFTGSFITNIAEYVIWILAFTNVFPAFNVQLKRNHQPGQADNKLQPAGISS